MTLTLQKRLSIYRKAKEIIPLHRSVWIDLFIPNGISSLEMQLPELYQQNPEPNFRLPIPERIACLEAAIKMCEEQLKEPKL